MAPFDFPGVAGTAVTLAIGFCFGFVLERSGFGNARKLAAQFYLHDMRVLKVMFTAIVTAMLLLFASAALGWLDFSRIWVPPTHLWPAVVGGLVLGVGFIIGGYCPGTSLVSMSTLKVDGAFFAFGVLVGTFLFAGSLSIFPGLWWFWNQAGNFGRWTLFEMLGVDAGVVVVAVFVMAMGAFWFAEQVEAYLRQPSEEQAPSAKARRLRRAAVAAGAAVAAFTLLVGQPTVDQRIAWNEQEFEQKLASREVFIDPAELLGLMHNNQLRLVMLDVRQEPDYNLFHLLDSRRVTLEQLEGDLPARLQPEAVIVTLSNDEQAAVEAWKRLAIHPNLNAYVLAGGINRWLDIYKDAMANVPGPEVGSAGEDQLRHTFAAALGERDAVSRPQQAAISQREFPKKVKVLGPVRMEGGGCG